MDGRVFGETVIGRGVYKKEIKICLKELGRCSRRYWRQ